MTTAESPAGPVTSGPRQPRRNAGTPVETGGLLACLAGGTLPPDAREALARVEALAADWDDPDYPIHQGLATDLRAALSPATPQDGQP